MSSGKTDNLVDSDAENQAKKSSSFNIWFSLVFLALISSGVLSYTYYSISYEKFLVRKGEEKKTVLELVSAFVSTYSGHRTAQAGIELPVPASFRASALKLFGDKREMGNDVTVQMVGLPDLSIKTAPSDEHMASVLKTMSSAADFTIWNNIIGGQGEEVLRTIKPVIASKPSCVSCHNKIQAPKHVWKLGDMMGAYVLDVPASGFISSLRVETGLLAFTLILFGLGGGAILMTQQHRFSRVQARMQHESERGEMLSEARDEARSLSAQLLKANKNLESALVKEKDLNELQRQFVSMASHELRTPLSIIDGSAQLLADNAENVTNEYLLSRTGKIRNAVKRMTQLMESTLSAARMQDGHIEIDIKPCDIGDIVQVVCERQQDIASNHSITCKMAELPGTILADASSVEQVLTNLLSNAVKYAPNAPDIEVTVRTEGDQVEISVRDHGLGIHEDDLARIGERFFRARTSTGIAGTGIGLNLVKNLVEMHGGTVSVESKEGEGSTFSICLPVAGPDQSARGDTRAA